VLFLELLELPQLQVPGELELEEQLLARSATMAATATFAGIAGTIVRVVAA
jgi:hypothetical protein